MPSPRLLINLIKQARKVPKKIPYDKWLRGKKPALIMSRPRGSQLYLEFDNRLGIIPSKQTIKDYARSRGFDADVTKYKGGLKDELTLGGIKDTTQYRLDVWKEGRLSSKAATDLSKMFGGDFAGPSAKLLGIKTLGEIPYREMLKGRKSFPSVSPFLSKRVRYEGIQQGVDLKPAYHTFTDKVTGSSFIVPLEENIEIGIIKRLRKLDEAFKGEKKYSIKAEKAKIIPLITKRVRDFHKRISKDINSLASEKQSKVRTYQNWKWNIGDRVYSPRTKSVYEITGKSWHTKRDEPFYLYKGLTRSGEKGGLFAKQAEEDLILLSGPKRGDNF